MRNYSSTAGAMSLSVAVGPADTTLSISSTTGLPTSYPYTLVVDVGLSSEEIVRVDAASGTALTVARGQDGTSGQNHGIGAAIRHMATAQDFREPQQHIAASSAVHGLTGTVVGTSDTQSLDNKTFVAAGTDHTPLTVKRRQAGDNAAIMRVQDESGVDNFQWSAIGMNVRDTAAGISFEALTPNGAGLAGWVTRIRSLANGVVGLVVRRNAGQTANMLELRDSDDVAVLAKFDSAAKLTVPQLTSNGPVSGTTGSFSGAVSGTAGTFSGQVQSNGANVSTQSGTETLTNKTISGASNTLSNIPQSAVTNLTADQTTQNNRLTTLESDTGWTNLSTAGFTGTVAQTIQYRVLRGVLYMRGAVQSFTGGSYVTLCTLPSQYWPGVDTFFPVTTNSTVNMSIKVTAATGVVSVFCTGSTAAFTSLAGVTYPI